ncbi:MAG: N-acetylmuramoyl-L-alanine amidase [Lachnospiraceae bacterium]|jgi:N-acetylmuramoyl-L-alanine amidase|nr:N-acetylmuramoyl-L-alanine amidase [Lachnospiraceae bacterium]MCI9356340.1 N-acetylmuramoyl-L-alanine amidase [Lachnospiraceae bacterium]
MNNYRKRYRRSKRIAERRRNVIIFSLCACSVLLLILAARAVWNRSGEKEEEKKAQLQEEVSWEGAPPLDVQLLTVNDYSRPAIPLEQINGIAVHYTANPGATAQQNRDYFENLKDSQQTQVSSHFVIGLEGEIIQCIPSSEMSYATNERNVDTLSIECCHPDETGKLKKATYNSLVDLTAWLCSRFILSTDDIIRHYDVTGKNCPKYFVENPEKWEQFKEDVHKKMENLKEEAQ